MNQTTLAAALKAALTPIRQKQIADRILTELEVSGQVSEATVEDLVHNRCDASSGQQVLLDLAKVLLDYDEEVAPRAHPAIALNYLGSEYASAYSSALRIVWDLP